MYALLLGLYACLAFVCGVLICILLCMMQPAGRERTAEEGFSDEEIVEEEEEENEKNEMF